MSDKSEKPKGTLIARVVANDPPPGLTLREWLVWRAQEDRRMAAELEAQREAFFERLHDDPTLH